jgi:hypothetical protein
MRSYTPLYPNASMVCSGIALLFNETHRRQFKEGCSLICEDQNNEEEGCAQALTFEVLHMAHVWFCVLYETLRITVLHYTLCVVLDEM